MNAKSRKPIFEALTIQIVAKEEITIFYLAFMLSLYVKIPRFEYMHIVV